jgi:hypothetical protein
VADGREDGIGGLSGPTFEIAAAEMTMGMLKIGRRLKIGSPLSSM